MTFRFRSLFLSPDAPAAALAPPAIPPANPQQRASSMADRLIARHGSAEAALSFLVTQAIGFEDTIATHERTITDLRGKVPAEGSVVLPKAEAESYAKVTALKLTPDQIVAAVGERDTLKGTVTRTEAAKQARAAAKVAGLDEEAFEVHALRESLTLELRDVQTTKNGKSVTEKQPFVRKGDDKAAFQALSDYTTALPAHDQRALKVTPTTPIGPQYIEQRPTPTTPQTGDPAGDFIKRMNDRAASRPNPMFPKVAQPATATP